MVTHTDIYNKEIVATNILIDEIKKKILMRIHTSQNSNIRHQQDLWTGADNVFFYN